MRRVLSGIGTELHLNNMLSSTAGQERGYDIVCDVGTFNSRKAQTEFIKRYLPADGSWEEFLELGLVAWPT